MYRKSTYLKHKYDLELVQIEEFDDNKQLTYIKEINREGTIETRFEFDENGNVSEEKNYVDGVISDTSKYLFDKDGSLLSHKFIIDNEVVEETIIEYSEFKTTETIFQNGEEAKKTITDYKEGESIELTYEFGELVEKKISEELHLFTKSIEYNSENEIVFFENYYFNEKDQVTKHEILTPNKEVISVENYTYDNENLSEISFSSDEESNCQKYYRDENDNLIKFEITDGHGRIVYFSHSVFDSSNREIEKVVLMNGNEELFEIKYEGVE